MNGESHIVLSRRLRRRASNHSSKNIPKLLAGCFVVFVGLCALTFFGGIGGAAAIYTALTQDLPDPSQIEAEFTQGGDEFFETTKIYDRSGNTLLYEVIDATTGDRQWVHLDQIPEICQNATIAIEDKSFRTNAGFDPIGIARAFWSNLRGGQVQGGSSITQQVVKNTLIDPEERFVQSYERKIKELILAVEISRRYSKDQILEWYLNTNNYSNVAYGIEAAAQVYFGKSAGQLDLAECAMLAPIPQFPRLNPIDEPLEAKTRQELALDAMVRDGYITPEESVAAKFQELRIAGGVAERFDIQAPHFSVYVRKWLEDHFGYEVVNRGGLKVYTTLDMDLQTFAQQAITEQVRQLAEEGHNANNGALVAIRPASGEVLAMVGSADYWNETIDGKFNVATGLRQPGSSFKPFTYITLLQQGYPASYGFLDVPTRFDQPGANPPVYVPENYDRRYHGYQRLRLALARSYNIPAVEALRLAGVDKVIRTAHVMGITTLDRGLDFYGLALTLGGGEVKLIDMVYAFGVFATNGYMNGAPVLEARPGYRQLDPVPVLRVEDSSGQILWQYSPDFEYTGAQTAQAQYILDEKYAYLMNSILSDNPARCAAFGCPNVLELDRPAAVKTGTTNDYKDNWTLGYTPQIAVGVWIGNTDNSEMQNVSGITGAAPVWHDVMAYYLKDKPVEPFVRPPGLVEKGVCATTGLLPTKYCPTTVELFIPGTEPTSYDTLHQAFLIDKETGKLATVFTPPDKVEEKIFEIYPPEAAEYVAAAEIPQPPLEYDTVYGPAPNAYGDAAIIDPGPYAYIHGQVVVTGNAKIGNFALYRLDFGQGLNPTQWQQIGPDHGNAVDQGPLELWEVTPFDGLYSLRLSVFQNDGNVATSIVQVTVDNISPTLRLIYPPNDQEYVFGKDEWISLNPDVQDNIAIDRLEFFADEETEPFLVRPVPPYDAKWKLDDGAQLGTHTLYARAYDKAGNVTESNRVRVKVNAKPAEGSQ
ncbi:MAG TPA: transglycosylase domain-containing protein [Anaerolineae bacterium]|nr:transglycosylase domain-containing protein [Anaerolineae bacterium]